MPTKRNKAGKQQPYVPEGHGDASGEYAEHGTGSNQHYVSPEDVKRQLGYTPKEVKPETKTPKDLVEKLNGSENEKVKNFKNTILGTYRLSKDEKEKFEKIIESADKECLDRITNLQNVKYQKTSKRAYFKPGVNSVNINKDDLFDELRPSGEVLFHEYGHAINWNSKLAGEMKQKANIGGFKNFEYTTKAPASYTYISEKYKMSLQDMLIEEYNNNLGNTKAKELEKEIRKNTDEQLVIRLKNKIGEENYNNFIKERDILYNQENEEVRKLEIERSAQTKLLYTNQITFKEFSPIQDAIINKINNVRDNTQNKIKEASLKYGNFIENKDIIVKNIKKENNAKYSSLSDVVSGASKGDLTLNGYCHSKKYWGESKSSRGDEFFAEAYSAKTSNPTGYNTFKQYFPKTMEIFEEILKRS